MPLIARKELKAATSPGGELGPMLRQSPGGRLVHHIGDDWPWRPGQNVNSLGEFRDHIGFAVQLSTVKFEWFVVPKSDVLGWGVMERRSVPADRTPDQTNTIAAGLVFGPLGAILGAAMDSGRADREGRKPVIALTYRVDGEEHALFLDSPLSGWYHKLHDFLQDCLPGRLRH